MGTKQFLILITFIGITILMCLFFIKIDVSTQAQFLNKDNEQKIYLTKKTNEYDPKYVLINVLDVDYKTSEFKYINKENNCYIYEVSLYEDLDNTGLLDCHLTFKNQPIWSNII